jgi:hypothetical protein
VNLGAIILPRLTEGNRARGILVGILKRSKGPTNDDRSGWSLVPNIMEDFDCCAVQIENLWDGEADFGRS